MLNRIHMRIGTDEGRVRESTKRRRHGLGHSGATIRAVSLPLTRSILDIAQGLDVLFVMGFCCSDELVDVELG